MGAEAEAGGEEAGEEGAEVEAEEAEAKTEAVAESEGGGDLTEEDGSLRMAANTERYRRGRRASTRSARREAATRGGTGEATEYTLPSAHAASWCQCTRWWRLPARRVRRRLNPFLGREVRYHPARAAALAPTRSGACHHVDQVVSLDMDICVWSVSTDVR